MFTAALDAMLILGPLVATAAARAGYRGWQSRDTYREHNALYRPAGERS
jgi:hypothetical protein